MAKKKILKIASFQETLNAGRCGPASLKIVLGYYGLKKSEDELAELCGTTKKLGTDDKGIKKAAGRLGFKVVIKNRSSFRDLEYWLGRGVPVIVNWFTRGRTDYPESAVPDGHYSVVAGLDDKFIFLEDPELGKPRKIKREDFLSVWFDFRGERITPGGLIVRQMIAIYK